MLSAWENPSPSLLKTQSQHGFSPARIQTLGSCGNLTSSFDGCASASGKKPGIENTPQKTTGDTQTVRYIHVFVESTVGAILQVDASKKGQQVPADMASTLRPRGSDRSMFLPQNM